MQRTPWDLVLALAYTLLVSIVLLVLGQGQWWAILLVAFFPGYVLVAALFPSRGLLTRVRRLAKEGERLHANARASHIDATPFKAAVESGQGAVAAGRLSEAIRLLEDGNAWLRARLLEKPAKGSRGPVGAGARPAGWRDATVDWTDRISLSIGLSIAIVALLTLVLNFTPSGIRLESIVFILLVFTVVVGLVAFGRRVALPVEDRLTGPAVFSRGPARPYSALEGGMAVFLALSIVFVGAVVTYVALAPRPVEQFTQFRIYDRNGTLNPDLYPTLLEVGEPGSVIIAITNNESLRINYTVRVDLVGLREVPGPSGNQTVEANRTALATFPSTLPPGGTWTRNFTFAINATGSWRVEFLLYRDGDFTTFYRRVRLEVEVVPRTPLPPFAVKSVGLPWMGFVLALENKPNV